MNLLLAFIVLAVVLMKGADVPLYQSSPAVVGAVEAGSPADRAGIKPGDRIVSIDGRDMPTWDALDMEVTPKANRALSVVDRAARRAAHARDHAGGIQQVRTRRSWRTARAAAAVRGDSTREARRTAPAFSAATSSSRSTASAGSISRRSIDKHQEERGTPLTFTIERDGEAQDIDGRARQRAASSVSRSVRSKSSASIRRCFRRSCSARSRTGTARSDRPDAVRASSRARRRSSS